jgi:coenzyme F420-reducing hydrogenase alpha subunit
MNDLSGQLLIRLDSDTGAVAIRSTRMLAAVRVFVGKTPVEAVRLLPTLFSLCGTAQAAACVEACEQALGSAPVLPLRVVRQQMVLAETIKEHLWRLLLDWPKALAPLMEPEQGLAAAMPAMAQVMQGFVRLRQSCEGGEDPFRLGLEDTADNLNGPSAGAMAELVSHAREQVFGLAPAQWLEEIDRPAALEAWAQRTPGVAANLVRALASAGLYTAGANAIPALPALPLEQVAQRLAGPDAADFIAAPQWEGRCRETGPVARAASHRLVAQLLDEFGNGLLAHLAALLVELARAAVALDSDSAPSLVAGLSPAPGVGIAQSAAARGLLVHRVSLVDGLIRDYRILAPTEWNFHPLGVVAGGLDEIARRTNSVQRMGRLARLYITAIDPCVEYELSVS